VFVVGEVTQPGAYQLASVATTLNGLYAAGGLTERANFRQIQVRRGGNVVAALDLYDYLLRGDTRNDVVLEQGDVVFVPVRGVRASVSGAVVRPAIYELKPGQTLADLVEAAGGFQPDASLERIAIHRMLPPAERAPGPAPRTVLDVRLGLAPRNGADPGADRDPFMGVAIPRVSLEDGDSVVVDSVTAPGGSLFVSILGMVRKPGDYPWREGMTLRELVTLARGPTVGADLREAEIAHLPAERNGGRLAEAVRVPLDSTYLFQRDSLGGYVGAAGLAFPAAGTAPQVVLQPYDQVTIFRQPQFELQRTVEITGEVQFAGRYALQTKDEHISDLVKRAGGLLPTAYTEGARFSRVMEQDTSRVNIDLGRVLARPQGPDDVVLRPGDKLTIPEYSPTVRVEGAVISPATVLYQQGAGLDYYVANAGGYARNADKGRVSVRYANGSARVKGKFLLFSSSPTPGPGSTVTVPSKPEGVPFNLGSFLASIAQIVASAVAIVAIAKP
jgi:protein involved in polysaccharide export with SLBB domain